MSADADTREKNKHTWTSGDDPAPAPPELDAETRKKNIAAFFATTARTPMLARMAGAMCPDFIAQTARALVRHVFGETPKGSDDAKKASEASTFIDAMPDEAILVMLSMSEDSLISGLGQGALNARMVELGATLGRKAAEKKP